RDPGFEPVCAPAFSATVAPTVSPIVSPHFGRVQAVCNGYCQFSLLHAGPSSPDSQGGDRGFESRTGRLEIHLKTAHTRAVFGCRLARTAQTSLALVQCTTEGTRQPISKHQIRTLMSIHLPVGTSHQDEHPACSWISPLSQSFS